VITPHIVRSHELTADDLKPMYIGTVQNFGQTGTPPLISADTPLPTTVTPPVVPAAGQTPQAQPSPGAPGVPPPSVPPAVPPPTLPAPPPAPSPDTPPAATPLISLFSPGTEFQSGAFTPYTVPITASTLPEVGTLTLRVTYDPRLLRAQAAVQGPMMSQGNVTATFVPRIDVNAGTVELSFSRPKSPAASAWNPAGLLGSVQFIAMAPGSAQINIAGSLTTLTGQSVNAQFGSVTVVVK
jgi:hypothetical protein